MFIDCFMLFMLPPIKMLLTILSHLKLLASLLQHVVEHFFCIFRLNRVYLQRREVKGFMGWSWVCPRHCPRRPKPHSLQMGSQHPNSAPPPPQLTKVQKVQLLQSAPAEASPLQSASLHHHPQSSSAEKYQGDGGQSAHTGGGRRWYLNLVILTYRAQLPFLTNSPLYLITSSLLCRHGGRKRMSWWGSPMS